MIKLLVAECAKKLNYFPAKYGISEYYSPRMIMHQENVDFDKHCKFSFGTYVQAHDEPNPSNKNRPRTLDCAFDVEGVPWRIGGGSLWRIATQ